MLQVLSSPPQGSGLASRNGLGSDALLERYGKTPGYSGGSPTRPIRPTRDSQRDVHNGKRLDRAMLPQRSESSHRDDGSDEYSVAVQRFLQLVAEWQDLRHSPESYLPRSSGPVAVASPRTIAAWLDLAAHIGSERPWLSGHPTHGFPSGLAPCPLTRSCCVQ